MWYPIRRLIVGPLLAIVAAAAAPATAADGLAGAHALSMFDDVKYGPGFEHFDYADPNAPTGGGIRLAALGTFDSLNPFILKGNPAAGSGLIYDSLLTGSLDEPFTEYGLLVESIDMAADRSWVAFTLREEARWHDGRPVTVDDVIWTAETLTTKGHPFYRHYYADISSVSQTGPRTVRFDFGDTVNRELPLIVGQIEVLPKHYWEGRDFESTTLEPPLGSGAYRIAAVEPGRSITLERVPDYWGRDLAVNRGQNNIDVIRYDYYRDATVAIEAFKAGEFDFRSENNSKEWGTAYDITGRRERPDGQGADRPRAARPACRRSGSTRDVRSSPTGDGAPRARPYVRLRVEQCEPVLRPVHAHRRASSPTPSSPRPDLRRAGSSRYWSTIATGFRRRCSRASTNPRPPTGPATSAAICELRERCWSEADWGVRDGTLIHAETGEAMEIEFLLVAPAFERIVGPVVQNMKRLGIVARIRIVDPAQYQNRVNEFDFDVVVSTRGQSLSPGNEQRNFWTAASADVPGSGNLASIRDPVVDELVDLLIQSPDRATLVATTRALDRVLLWGHYVIPQWHIRSFRLVYWNKFGRPQTRPKYGLGFPATWWIDREKDARLEASR